MASPLFDRKLEIGGLLGGRAGGGAVHKRRLSPVLKPQSETLPPGNLTATPSTLALVSSALSMAIERSGLGGCPRLISGTWYRQSPPPATGSVLFGGSSSQ